MSVTFTTIATNCAADLGLVAANEPLPAFMEQDFFRRANNMLAGWRTQYGTVTSIDRWVFPLVANQQTYSIGPGGEFNVARPLTIPGAGLLLNGLDSPVAVTSITRSSATATVTQTAHGHAVGDQVNLLGANETEYNGLQTVVSVPTSNTWTYVVDGSPSSPATGTITASALSDQPVEVPRTVITDDAYQAIPIKSLTNAQFTNVYYNPTYPLGTVFLWPCPNTAINQLVLYLQNAFLGFASVSRSYDFPDVPGYAEAIQYQLDLRLITPYGVKDPDILGNVRELAAQTFGLIKRANNRLSDLPTDASVLAAHPRSLYNINTGSGGAGGN